MSNLTPNPSSDLAVRLVVEDGKYLAQISLAQRSLAEAALRVTRTMRALHGAPRWIGQQWWETR